MYRRRDRKPSQEKALPATRVDTSAVEIGVVPKGESRTREVAVTSVSSHPLRLAGWGGELC